MKPFSPTLCITLLLIAAFTQACNFTTANIERAVMARSVDENSAPVEETASFNASESLLHCAVKMENTPSGTRVKAIWYYMPEDEERQVLDSTEITIESGAWIDFTLRLAEINLPYGSYVVDLYVDDEYRQNVPFTIEPMYPDSWVKEAVMAKSVSADYFPTEVTWVFEEGSDNIYAPIYAAGQPEGSVFAAVWYVHDASGNREEISSYELSYDEEGWIGFSLSLPNGLPAGKYSVDILVNDEVQNTLEFRAE
ncbi:MAG: hypothetical protein RRA94_08110 [Bacteroidota bacterium]|nr:hypothetical protein [Bacteroidota bacterium]